MTRGEGWGVTIEGDGDGAGFVTGLAVERIAHRISEGQAQGLGGGGRIATKHVDLVDRVEPELEGRAMEAVAQAMCLHVCVCVCVCVYACVYSQSSRAERWRPSPPLATGYWPLATGHWLLATGYWPLTTGHWLLATGYWLLATGH